MRGMTAKIQFRMRGVLAATAWFAVGCAASVFAAATDLPLAVFSGAWCLTIAVGALFEQTLAAFVLGMPIAGTLCFLMAQLV